MQADETHNCLCHSFANQAVKTASISTDLWQSYAQKQTGSFWWLTVYSQTGQDILYLKNSVKMNRFLWLMERGILMIFYINRCKLVQHTWTMSLHYLVNCRRTYIHTWLYTYLYKWTGQMAFLPPNQQCQSTEGYLHTYTHIYIAPKTVRMKYDLQYQAKRVGSNVTSVMCNIISSSVIAVLQQKSRLVSLRFKQSINHVFLQRSR